MKRTILSAVTVLSAITASALMMLVSLSSCSGDSKRTEGSMPEETVDVALPEVDTVTLTKIYPGYIMAERKVDVVARVNGYLTGKYYNSGDYVRQGTVLFRIEDTQLRDAAAQAQAQLATAQATYDYDKRHYEAMKKALVSDAVSEMAVIQAESDMKNALAAIHNAQAALETARKNLSYCTVTAPFSGHVSASVPDPGAYVSGAASPVTLATIFDDSRVMASFNVDDADLINTLRNKGTSDGLDFNNVPVTFEDSLVQRYTGRLSYIAPDVDKSTGTLQVRVTIDNSHFELKDGMFAKVTLPTQRIANAILIKDSALSTDQAGKYVYVVSDSGRVVYTPVKVSELVNDSMRVVTSGLAPTDRYVTQALLKVRDGMKVKTHLVK